MALGVGFSAMESPDFMVLGRLRESLIVVSFDADSESFPVG